MKCQEVMEFMQRYLDKDLEDAEHESLLLHLQQCPACTELFERLKKLSADLESLPKVTPAYSIVDSIMPRLNELDADLRNGPGSKALEIQSAGQGFEIRKPENAPARKTSWRNRISFRIVGGVVAAGLAIGMFLFNQDHSQTKNSNYQAEEMASKAESGLRKQQSQAGSAQMYDTFAASKVDPKSAASAEDKGAALKQDEAKLHFAEPVQSELSRKAMPEQSPAPDVSAGASGDDAAATHFAAPAAPAPQAPAAPAPRETASEQPGPAPGANSVQQPVNPPAPTSPPPGTGGQSDASAAPPAPLGAEQLPAPSPLAPQAVPAPSAKIAPDAASASESTQSSAAGQSGAEAADQTSRGPALKVTPPAVSGGSEGMLGISAAETAGIANRDGSLTARLEDLRVVIRSKDGLIVFSSARQWKETDTVTLKMWTESDELTYEVVSGSSTTIYTIKASDKTEQEKASAR
jgi:hypothetical protein